MKNWTLLLASAFILMGCGFGKSGSQSLGGAGLATFSAQVHPILRQYCTNCHGTTQGPLFAVSSASTAYPAAIGELNLVSPSSSDLYDRAGDGHNGCGTAATPWCNTVVQKLGPTLAAWAQAELNAGSDLGINLPNQTIPSNINGNFTPINWDLGIIDPALNGVTFRINIRTDGENYEISQPTLVISGASTLVAVKKIVATINGQPTGTSYISVDTTAEPPSTILSMINQILPSTLGPGADVISFRFSVLQAGAMPCNDLNSFIAKFRPTIDAVCKNCHAGGGGTPGMNLTSNDNASLCGTVRQRTNLFIPVASQLYQFPTGGVFQGLTHPPGQVINQTQADSLLEFIMDEAAASGF